VTVDLAAVPAEGIERNDELLFSESQSRFVATIRPEAKGAFEAALKGCTLACIGTVTAEAVMRVQGLKGQAVIEEPLADLKAAWQAPLAAC
jgi:phosphoribosylformylglycinamidine synthase